MKWRFLGIVRCVPLVRCMAMLGCFLWLSGGYFSAYAQSVPSSSGAMDGNLFKNHVSVYGLGGAPTPQNTVSGLPYTNAAVAGSYYVYPQFPYATYYPQVYYPQVYPYGYYPYTTYYGWGGYGVGMPYYQRYYRGYSSRGLFGNSRMNTGLIQFGQMQPVGVGNMRAWGTGQNFSPQNRPAPPRLTEQDAFTQQLHAAAQSSAGQGAESISDILRQREHESGTKKSESSQLVEKAQRAIAEGKTGLAKMYLHMAMDPLQGPQREEIQEMLNALESKDRPQDSPSQQ